jgi:hypothetical protein
MSEVFDDILSSYNKRSEGMTHLPMSEDDIERLGNIENAVMQIPTLRIPILIAFHVFISGIESERRVFRDGSQLETKWTRIVPTLETIIDEYRSIRNHFPATLQDHQIVMALVQYYNSLYTKTCDRLSHPFICHKGEVEKAIRLNEVLHSLNFRANRGYLISVGAIFGLLDNKLKDLNTKIFLDYCRFADIVEVCANTIDGAQLKQITEYGNHLGIQVDGWQEDGSKINFNSEKKSIAVIDGYSIRFQTAKFVNEFKKRNIGSIAIVTITKPKNTRTSEKFDTKLCQFIKDCHYNCTVVPYGSPKEEAMVVIGNYSVPVWSKINIPNYTYSKELLELFCNSFRAK